MKSSVLILGLAALCILLGCSNPTDITNHPPEIDSIIANPSPITVSMSTTLTCVATDIDMDSLTYTWSSNGGVYAGNLGKTVRWTAPDLPGIFICEVIVSDGKDTVRDSITFSVDFPNRPPLTPYNPQPSHGATNVSITPTLTWECSDPDEDPITYDIYFGKVNYIELIIRDHPMTSFSPDTLERGQYYGWYIQAKDDHGNYSYASVRDAWKFWTEQ